MRLKVTLREPGGTSGTSLTRRHIQITADATATAGDVASAIAAAEQSAAPAGDAEHLTLRIVESAGGDRDQVTLPREVSLLETGLRSGSTVELCEPVTTAAIEKQPPVAMLRVLAGPDTQLEVPLRTGYTEIGRSGRCGVRLRDPSASKRHARLIVGERVEIVDLNSANGVVVGGVRVARTPIGPGDVVTLGNTQFSVLTLRPSSGLDSTSTDITFVRSPRVVHRPDEASVDLPEVPRPPNPPRFPWLAMIAPLIMGVGLFAMTRSPLSLVFVALSPVIMLGNYIEQRRSSRQKHELALATFGTEMARAQAELDGHFARERAELGTMYPLVSECMAAAARLGELVWSRRPEHPEFLQLRLGTGAIPPHCRIERGRRGGIAQLSDQVDRLAAQYALLPDAPVVADLRSAGGVGICGVRSASDGVVTGVVCQIVTLHSPAEVVLACLTSTARKERWQWLEWLPHSSSPHSPLGSHQLSSDPGTGRTLLAHLEELVELRSAAGSTSRATVRGPLTGAEPLPAPTLPSVVVIVDEASVDLARLIRVAERGPDVGVHVLWVAASRGDLPAACRTFLDVTDGSKTSVGLVREGEVISPVWCESVADGDALGMARAMAPLVDGGAPVDDESDLPMSVPMVYLLGQRESDDPEAVITRWQENESLIRRDLPARKRSRGADLLAVVGHAGSERFTIDLRTHGPHALVGGTTGAGKSEFLQAWVLGMAHANSPDRVTFLFVDYKGGAAFARCVDLPHCVGLVTDLSEYLVRRALRSLRAELRYRERLLNAKGAKDLLELEKTGDPECPPSLIIVVDEFAALVSEVPDFVDGVVDVAQRGRSLGLHLILATQRPAGVIKDNLRANTNLRVALRMADEHDSQDVLGSPMAAHFPASIPGRGAAKTGPGRIVQFQSAFPGARTPPEPPAPPIEITELDFGAGQPWRLPERKAVSEDVPTDIERVVTTIAAAAARAAVPAPRKPWLSPLAPAYNLEKLGQRRDTDLVLGVVDDPDNQEQRVEHFHPDAEGNILYVGAGGSGKSTALRSLAVASAITPRSGPVHVYALDFAGGGLASLEVLPNVGSVISGDDDERVARLLRMLADTADDRAGRYSAVRASTLVEYRELARRPDEPRILVLVDGFGSFRNQYESSIALLQWYNMFQRLLVDGRSVGIHFAVTADRPAAVPTSVASAFQRKIVLRQTDEDGYIAMGVPKDVLDPSSPPGRCMPADHPMELQLAILGDSVNAAEQAKLTEELAHDIAGYHRQRPAPIESLPATIPAAGLPAAVDGLPVLGVADETLQPVGFVPSGVLLVAGPAQSGRTTAVRWLAESLRRRYPDTPLVHICARRSPLSEASCWTNSAEANDAAELLDKVKQLAGESAPAASPLLGLFVEGLPDLVGSPVEMALQEIVKACRRNGHPMIVEGESTTWGSPWPLIMEVRNARTGLLLQPDQMDGDNLLRTSLPRVRRADFPPGRGFYVRSGKTTKVQIPLVD